MKTRQYYQPILQSTFVQSSDAIALGWQWFDRVVVHQRGEASRIVAASDIPEKALAMLTTRHGPIAGLGMDQPKIMGILNVTPDSFSDGGLFINPQAAVDHALSMVAAGADILDIGGESTRPGAKTVSVDEEIARTAPVIAAIRAASDVPISIDTRKGEVAQAALQAGANLVNDVAALTFDDNIGRVTAAAKAPVCLMHAQGDPETMQNDPRYDNVLLDVYDFLETRVSAAIEMGISKDAIVIDPGIGFGKNIAHNLALLDGLSLFHGLGCPILLGASRKRFIGALGRAETARDRTGGSIAVALQGISAGVHFLRVHDTFETKQALRLAMAMITKGG